jgi:hypothetical protein
VSVSCARGLKVRPDRADVTSVENVQTGLRSGTVMISPTGRVKILRSRTANDDGWNCSDGAALTDEEARDTDQWIGYTPDELAAQLRLAREVTRLSGERELSGGLATWDACSGRPCVLPRLARLVS